MGPTPPPPPPVINTPPNVTAVTANAEVIEAATELSVTASVTDAETPVDQLTYTWTATPAGGEFIGTGRAVRWKAPAGATSPGSFVLNVTVSEQYTSQGILITNTATGSSSPIRYNDSPAEINGIAVQFYADFGNYQISADQCVRNFSDSCSGKREERSQIADNRRRTDLRIVGSTLLGAPSIAINSRRTSATFTQRCRFEDVDLRNGQRWRVEGDCFLSAVYENWRWWLCTSNFNNGVVSGPVAAAVVPSMRELRLMAPGWR